MRATTLVSLVASCVLLSQSPVAYGTAAPVSSQDKPIAEKRCVNTGCRIAELPDTDTTSQFDVQNLVEVLITSLQKFQALNAPPSFNTTVELATPTDTGV